LQSFLKNDSFDGKSTTTKENVKIWTIKVEFFFEENDGICKIKIEKNVHIKKQNK
jgi:hypothetical protein